VRRFHTIGVRDVYRKASGIAAKRIDRAGRDFTYYQASKSRGAKSLIEKESCLNGSKAESYKSAIACQGHGWFLNG
jgi:hypothetical protein